MRKKTIALFIASVAILTVISACGNKTNEGNNNPANQATEQPTNTGSNTGNAVESATPDNSPSNTPSDNSPAPDASASTDSGAGQSSDEILIIIDQTEKPIEGNSFDFTVNKRPEGYALSKMEWKGEKHQVANTVQEAIEHGGNGEDGFYISGNGQFMGFIYPDDLKGEKGDVIFTFANEQGKELTWKKSITLK